MLTRWLSGLVLALGCGLAVSTAGALPLPRDALWLVVRSCVLAEETFGRPFPCLDVKPASGVEPGFAVLRAPGRTTHVIVTPTIQVAGLESPELQRDGAKTYWRAALDARRYVAEAAGGRVPSTAIGLAINSSATRSQDQLHIHAECFRPAILRRLRDEPLPDAATWHPLRGALDGEQYLLRPLSGQDIVAGNLFTTLATLPGVGGDLSRTKVVVVEGSAPGRFIVAVSRSGRHSIERLLDDSCVGTLRPS